MADALGGMDIGKVFGVGSGGGFSVDSLPILLLVLFIIIGVIGFLNYNSFYQDVLITSDPKKRPRGGKARHHKAGDGSMQWELRSNFIATLLGQTTKIPIQRPEPLPGEPLWLRRIGQGRYSVLHPMTVSASHLDEKGQEITTEQFVLREEPLDVIEQHKIKNARLLSERFKKDEGFLDKHMAAILIIAVAFLMYMTYSDMNKTAANNIASSTAASMRIMEVTQQIANGSLCQDIYKANIANIRK